jgi:hypothetical protein
MKRITEKVIKELAEEKEVGFVKASFAWELHYTTKEGKEVRKLFMGPQKNRLAYNFLNRLEGGF